MEKGTADYERVQGALEDDLDGAVDAFESCNWALLIVRSEAMRVGAEKLATWDAEEDQI